VSTEAQELQAIRTTLAAYSVAGDRMQLEALAATFTAEGILEISTGGTFHGREAIVTGLRAGGNDAQARPRPSFVRHHLTTSLIELRAAQAAEGRTYFIVFTDIGADHAGFYSDKLCKVDGRWLFQHRRVMIDWVSEASLFPSQRQAYLARRAKLAARSQ
jgi:hypothetical protein